MNNYEGMFLLDHGKVKNEVQKGIDEITAMLEKHGGKIEKIGKWDERKLAYEIKRQKRGIYVLVHFQIVGDKIADLRHEFMLNELVVRQLFIRLPATFPPFMTASEYDSAFGTRDFRDRGPRRDGPGGGRPDRPAPRPVEKPAAEKPAEEPAAAATPDSGEGSEG